MSGPSGFSPNATRAGVSAQVRQISPKTWITLAVVFGFILFLIVSGIMKADQARQQASLQQEATVASVPTDVSGMIGEAQQEETPRDIPPPPPPPPPPAPPAGPTYQELALAQMYAQEMEAISQPLGSGGLIGGLSQTGFDESFDVQGGSAGGLESNLSALEQQLQGQMAMLSERIAAQGGAPGASGLPGGITGSPASGASGALSGVTTDTSGVRFEAAPRVPVIQEGWVVPARLDQLVTSDIGGQVRAIVTADVYDSVTGQFLLIPAGSKAIGQYDNGVVFGQNRLAVMWTRIIFPDGSSLHIDAPGTDGKGSVGLRDRVNNHWGKVIGAALLSTVFSVGVSLANDDQGSVFDQNSTADIARSTAANEVARVGSAVTGRALTIPPTIEIRPGYALQIRVNRDWYLQPWRRVR